jgi:hypothetical protein
MQTSKIVQAVALAVPLVALGCGPQRADTREGYAEPSPGMSAPAAQAGAASVSLGSQVGADGRLAHHAETFKRGEPVIASVEPGTLPAGATVRLTWTGPQGLPVAQEEITMPADARSITFKAQDTTGWTPGQYRVETTAGGTSIGSKTFTLE